MRLSLCPARRRRRRHRVLLLTLLLIPALRARRRAVRPPQPQAALLLAAGVFLARFIGKLVASAGSAANLSYAKGLGAVAQTSIVVMVAVVTLEQLGVDTQILVTVITVTVAAITAGVDGACAATGMTGVQLEGDDSGGGTASSAATLPASSEAVVGEKRGADPRRRSGRARKRSRRLD